MLLPIPVPRVTLCSHTSTRCSGPQRGGFRSRLLTKLKIVVFAPMPSPSERMATMANAGFLTSVRKCVAKVLEDMFHLEKYAARGDLVRAGIARTTMISLARRAAVCSVLAAVVTRGILRLDGGPSSSPGGVVLVLGDSLAVSPSRVDAFPAELQKRLDSSARGWTVNNAGVSGDTTSGGLGRFEQALTTDTRVVVLELGANDGLRGVDVSAIEKNLSTMIETAQARGIKVLLCGMEAPPLHGFNYTLDFHRLFPRLAQKVQRCARAVPAPRGRAESGPERQRRDPPERSRRKRIADTVWPYLQPSSSSGSSLTV
jgi:acyl-CoA thioesterase-1